jgi:hypothetical protein
MGEGISIYAEMLNTNCESFMDWTTSYHSTEITSVKYYEKKLLSCQDINRSCNEIKWQPEKETKHSINLTQKCFHRCH